MPKILLTTVSPEFESDLDPRFGRATYFLLVDPETLAWEAVANPGVFAPGGAGTQAAQLAASHQCSAVISGDFGPNAFQALNAAGIPMYLFGSSLTVQEVVERYKNGRLESMGQVPSAGHKGRGRLR